VAIAVGAVISGARRTHATGLLAQAVGVALIGIAGFAVFISDDSLGASFTSELEPRLGVDQLSGFFLFVLGIVGAPALVFATRYLAPDAHGRVIAALTGAFVLVLALVLCARDPLTFLAGWELMTLVPAAIILVGRHDREARHSVFVYIGLTHLLGAGTWIAVLLLADARAFGDAGAVEAGSGTQIAIALAALVGMGTKAGLVPVHTWLPRAHPIAPAHVSALMSGVMIKIAIYGLVRVLVEWLGELPIWIGVAVIAAGAVSAVVGVAYAIFQHELKRLLAFHSIENVGIIVLGLGACLVLHSIGEDEWAGVALAAALLHTLNHAVFKGLLFLGAGAFEKAAGSLEIDRLGGLLRRMPRTGTAFLIGAMAIAGLPPLNGFASEWLTLQSLLAVPANGGVGAGLAGAVALGALAATAALAVLCFVKVGGSCCSAGRDEAASRRPSRRPSRCGAPSASSPSRASCSESSPDCLPVRSRALPPGRRTTRQARSSPYRGTTPFRHPESRSCSSSGRCSSSLRGVAVVPRPRRAGPAVNSSSPSSHGRAPGSRSRCASCWRPSFARRATSPSRCAAACSRRCATRATSRTCSTRI
jgi:formate hydrogenlyase subunit 3/multisubunit Na+/H+ antiporter MnhD subunit